MFLPSSKPWSGLDLAEVDVAVDAGAAEATAVVVEAVGDICRVVEVDMDEEEEVSAEVAEVVAVVTRSTCRATQRVTKCRS